MYGGQWYRRKRVSLETRTNRKPDMFGKHLKQLPLPLRVRFIATRSLLGLKQANYISCFNYGYSSLNLDTTVITHFMPQIDIPAGKTINIFVDSQGQSD